MNGFRTCVIAGASLLSAAFSQASEFRHVGDYVLQSRVKLTGAHAAQSPIKPLLLHVSTDGVEVRIAADGDEEARSVFEIYRSDGIGRQSAAGGSVEIIPGVQAISRQGGQFRHLRLTREALTITAFPGISDQTIVTHAVAVANRPAIPESPSAPGTPDTPVPSP
jgi:hypothetical protein